MSSQVETAADRLQALGAFDKSAVDAAELSGQEIARVLVRLGLGAPELAVKLTNGACAANYRCVLRDGPPVVLKACVGDDCRELAPAPIADPPTSRHLRRAVKARSGSHFDFDNALLATTRHVNVAVKVCLVIN